MNLPNFWLMEIRRVQERKKPLSHFGKEIVHHGVLTVAGGEVENGAAINILKHPRAYEQQKMYYLLMCCIVVGRDLMYFYKARKDKDKDHHHHHHHHQESRHHIIYF